MLGVERRICDSAKARVGDGSGLVCPEVLARAFESHPQLDHEQRRGVEKLLTSGNGLDVVIGQAGTGKSTMLGAARAGWEAAGYEVIGVAIASRTGRRARSRLRHPVVTMARLRMDLADPARRTLTDRHVVVVDEASMVGSRSLDLVQRYADRSGAKVVLVGDLPADRFHRRRGRSAHPVTRARGGDDRAHHQPPPGRHRPGLGTPGPGPAPHRRSGDRPWTPMPSTSGSP